MARETVRAKAVRYLAEGRVVVVHVSKRHGVHADVRGDGAIYRTTWQAGDWTCSCPHTARTTFCSHIHAMRRVVAVDLEERDR